MKNTKIVLAAMAYLFGNAGASVSFRYLLQQKGPVVKRPGLWWFLGTATVAGIGATVIKREVESNPKLTLIEFPDTEELFGPDDETPDEPGDYYRIGEDGELKIERVEDVQGKVGTLEEGL